MTKQRQKKPINNSVAKDKKKALKEQNDKAEEEQRLILIEAIDSYDKTFEELNIKVVKPFTPISVGILSDKLFKIEAKDEFISESIALNIIKKYNEHFEPTLDIDSISSYNEAKSVLIHYMQKLQLEAELNKKK